MQLVDARVTYYRSVEDSEEFTIERDVTCLVGKNESGKTNIAQTLFRVNPVEPATFDEVIDFPARMTARKKEFRDGKMIPVVAATFRYDDDELADITADLGPGALTSPEFTVTVGYRSAGKTIGHQYDEEAIVGYLASQLDLGPAALLPLKRAKTAGALLAALKELPEPTSATEALAGRISGWRDQSIGAYLIDKYAMPLMPKFVYFADYDTMPGKVSIPDLIRRRDQKQLTRGERALLALLDMADVSLEDFSRTDQHERLIRELENAGNAISDEVFEYWSQNKDLSVKLSVHPPEEGAAAPLNEGPILFVRVDNHRHRATVPFDERSRGFVWFFSFLAYFSELEEGRTSNLIVLLDEPGLSLHARAQQDLLRLIDERLAPHHQVIYTTHSPFLVSPGQFNRVRTVIDHERGGTKVSAEIFKADEDTVSPLLTAMGIEMTQTLFIGEHTLLLEGPSDLIYLDVLSDLTETRQLTGLDPRWVKTPIGGSGKLLQEPFTGQKWRTVRGQSVSTDSYNEHSRRKSAVRLFLSGRSSDSFLRAYLDIDPGLPGRMLDFGPQVNLVTEPDVLARLHQAGLLGAPVRLQAVERVAELAIDIPDSGWTTGSAWEALLTPRERSALMQRVREELVPYLEDSYWLSEEKESDYDPIQDSLDGYKEAFERDGDRGTAQAFEIAARRRAEQPAKDEYYVDDDDRGGGYRRPIASSRLAPPPASGRSIFDDIDQ